jgi:vitamin B12/bleomycin/antimicrobial peptide transport system ATP-binding/permease protein
MDQPKSAFWRHLWAVVKPYWISNEKYKAWGMLFVLLLLLAAVNGLNVVINYVAGNFMTALQEKNEPEFWKFLWIYGGVFVAAIPIVAIYPWMREKLAMNWRRWLTAHLLDKYFKDRAYYRVNNLGHIDNPDERIAYDVDAVVRTALVLMLLVLDSIVTFASFITILWMIAPNLVWMCIGYAIVGTGVTFWFGKRLIKINYDQAKLEADFRYGLVHVRNNTESIAFYRGENNEKNEVMRRLKDALSNFNLLIGWTRNIGFVQKGYDYFIVLVPYIVIAPLFFAGTVKFGVLTQANMAFNQILLAVSLLVMEFTRISQFTAYVGRLGGFVESLEAPAHKPGDEVIETATGSSMDLTNVTVMTPNYARTLVKDLTVTVNPGDSILIVGPSGSGKSSMLRVLGGLWDFGRGKASHPKLEDMLFLPQLPYMVLGSLRNQLAYPLTGDEFTDEQLQTALETVGLPELAKRSGGFATVLNWGDTLSPGEQQRVAFARLLLTKPKYAILDEATSALDVKNEERLYGLLKTSGTTVISVGHRPTLVKHHDRVLELKGDGGWRVIAAADYDPSAFTK